MSEFALAAIPVGGRQAAEFLQAQLAGDLDTFESDGRLQATAWCRPDGRAEIITLIARRQDGFLLVLPAPMLETALKKLRMFSIGRDVRLGEPVAVAETAIGEQPGHPLAHDPGRGLRLDSTVDALDAPPLSPAWLAADADAGMPWLLPATSGLFLPQMLGLEALHGLSYRKGCYPGQEIIARVHYRGRVTRRLARLELDAGTVSEPFPGPGLEIALESASATVLYATRDPRPAGGVTGLTVVPADLELPCPIMIEATGGRLLAV